MSSKSDLTLSSIVMGSSHGVSKFASVLQFTAPGGSGF
jgi:hypothetical protein